MNDMIVAWTGELIDLDDHVKVADSLYRLFEVEREVKDAKRILVDALLDEVAVQGKRTLRLGDLQVELTSDTKTEYDLEKLADLLTEAGLPEERLNELIITTITQKPNHSVIKQLRGANPRYAEAIGRCEQVVPATVYAKVKRL